MEASVPEKTHSRHRASASQKTKINRNPDEGRLFCDGTDPLFTADVVSHRARSREGLGAHYTPGRLILPMQQLSEEVSEMAAHVLAATQSQHE